MGSIDGVLVLCYCEEILNSGCCETLEIFITFFVEFSFGKTLCVKIMDIQENKENS